MDEVNWATELSENPEIAPEFEHWGEIDSWSMGDLFKDHPEFATYCKWEQLTGNHIAWLLVSCPQYADKCNLTILDEYDWSLVLTDHPQFATFCDKWDEFRKDHWVNVLVAQPQFADKCDKWSEFSSSEWAKLVSAQPDFIARCDLNALNPSDGADIIEHHPQFAEKFDRWSELDAVTWRSLLGAQPQFASRCDKWDELDGYDWAILLTAQPSFADKCDWHKLEDSDIKMLLSDHQEMVEKWAKSVFGEPVSRLERDASDETNCSTSLKQKGNPQTECAHWPDTTDVLIVYCKKTGATIARTIESRMMSNGYTVSILSDDDSSAAWNEKIDKADSLMFLCTPMDASSFVALFRKSLASHKTIVPVWPNNGKPWIWTESIPEDIAEIRKLEPTTLDMIGTLFDLSLEKACQRLPDEVCSKNADIRTLMKDGRWGELLIKHPALVGVCDLDKLSVSDWIKVVDKWPALSSYCKWNKFDVFDWLELLELHSEYADKFDWKSMCDWNEIEGGGWCRILVDHPELADRCDWHKLCGANWVNVLIPHPGFAKNCDWKTLDGSDWRRLLTSRPEFADKCKWWKLESADWAELLKKQPCFADKCPWHKMNVGNTVELLLEQPTLVGFCNWKRMPPEGWVCLLRARPEFSPLCDFEQFTSSNWACLVKFQGRFDDACDFDSFSGDDWLVALTAESDYVFQNGSLVYKTSRPRKELIDKCDCAKFSGANWAEILISHPELSSHCDWDLLDGDNWAKLLDRSPAFSEHCIWDKLNGANWVMVLKRHPEFAGSCNWSILSDSDWAELLKEQPAFEIHKPKSLDKSLDADVGEGANAEVKLCFDVFIGCIASGEDVANRLAKALMDRGFSTYVGELNAEECTSEALGAAKYFMLIRSPRLYETLSTGNDSIVDYVRKAIESNKVIIPIGPSDRYWQESVSLQEEFKSIETLQVKNLDMGNLFEEKVDTIVEDCMRGVVGALNRNYDIFISYRRSTGAEVARLLQQQFKRRGYTVFLDYDSIRNGKYDQVILAALKNVKVFLMLLTKESLDRCKDPNDWVAAEIIQAHELGKDIVAVTPDTSQFTEPPLWPEKLKFVREMPVDQVLVGADLSTSIQTIEEKFPVDLKEKNAQIVEMITEGKWADLMINFPELEDICAWDAFKDGDWSRLLRRRPEFEYKCDWSKIGNYRHFGLASYDSEWADLLNDQPQFAKYCDISTLRPDNKADLIASFPDLADPNRMGDMYERTWDGTMHWIHILCSQPQLFDMCDATKFEGHDWAELMVSQPQFADKCEWEKFTGKDWLDLLRHHPEFVDNCNWTVWDGKSVVEMVEREEKLIEHCKWNDLTGGAWAELLKEHPQYSNFCDWSKLTAENWADLLCENASFSEKCDWNILGDEEWNRLLPIHPEFAKYSETMCAIHDAIADADSIDTNNMGFGLFSLLWIWPEFVNKVDAEELKQLEGEQWVKLLKRDVHLAECCLWERLNGHDWAELLCAYPQFADRCDWSLIDDELWDDLLSNRPELNRYKQK